MKAFARAISSHSRKSLRLVAWIALVILILAALFLAFDVANRVADRWTSSFRHLDPLSEDSLWSR